MLLSMTPVLFLYQAIYVPGTQKIVYGVLKI